MITPNDYDELSYLNALATMEGQTNMTPDDHKEFSNLLDRYAEASYWDRGSGRDEAKAALIAFVDRLANSQLHKIIKAQAALLVSYRVGGRPAEWVFKIMDESRDQIQAILKGEK